MCCVNVKGTTKTADDDVETQEGTIAGIYLEDQGQFEPSFYNREHGWEGRT